MGDRIVGADDESLDIDRYECSGWPGQRRVPRAQAGQVDPGARHRGESCGRHGSGVEHGRYLDGADLCHHPTPGLANCTA